MRKSCFWSFGLKKKCFWKTFKLILMHFIHEILWIECFLHKTSIVFQKSSFPEFLSIECVFWLIENPLIFKLGLYLVRLILDWYSISRICFSIDQNQFSTDRNLKVFKANFCLAQLVLDQYSTDQDSKEKKNKSLFQLMCFLLFQIVFFLFLPFSFSIDPIQDFFFSSSNLQRFLSSSVGKT